MKLVYEKLNKQIETKIAEMIKNSIEISMKAHVDQFHGPKD